LVTVDVKFSYIGELHKGQYRGKIVLDETRRDYTLNSCKKDEDIVRHSK